MLQQRDGTFSPSNEQPFARDRISEDVGAAFFDAAIDRMSAETDAVQRATGR